MGLGFRVLGFRVHRCRVLGFRVRVRFREFRGGGFGGLGA